MRAFSHIGENGKKQQKQFPKNMEIDNEGVFVSAMQWKSGMKKHYLSNFLNLAVPTVLTFGMRNRNKAQDQKLA
jgi:hypothetical protein